MGWDLAIRVAADLLLIFSNLLVCAALVYLSVLARKMQKEMAEVAKALPKLSKDIEEIRGFEAGLGNVAGSIVTATELLGRSVDRLSQYFIADGTRAPTGLHFQQTDESSTSAGSVREAEADEMKLAKAHGNLLGEV